MYVNAVPEMIMNIQNLRLNLLVARESSQSGQELQANGSQMSTLYLAVEATAENMLETDLWVGFYGSCHLYCSTLQYKYPKPASCRRWF